MLINSAGSNAFILRTNSNVFKVPRNFKSFLNLKIEFEKTKMALKDDNLKRYVNPMYCKLGFVLSSNKLCFNSALSRNDFIDEYQNIFLKKELFNFGDLLTNGFLKFVGEISTELLVDVFKKKVFCSSVHGDVHRYNILLDEGCFKLIDWRNYHLRFWYLYDVMHFKLMEFYFDNRFDTWFNAIKEFECGIMDKILYCVSRCFLEYEVDFILSRLTCSRIIKYHNILRWCDSKSE